MASDNLYGYGIGSYLGEDDATVHPPRAAKLAGGTLTHSRFDKELAALPRDHAVSARSWLQSMPLGIDPA